MCLLVVQFRSNKEEEDSGSDWDDYSPQPTPSTKQPSTTSHSIAPGIPTATAPGQAPLHITECSNTESDALLVSHDITVHAVPVDTHFIFYLMYTESLTVFGHSIILSDDVYMQFTENHITD